MISMLRPASAHLDLDLLSSSSPSRSILRNFWRVVAVARSRGSSVEKPTSRGVRQQHVEHALLGGVLGARRAPCAHRLLARHA